MDTSYQAIKFIYQSYVTAKPHIAPGLMDVDKRNPVYCRRLLDSFRLAPDSIPTVLVAGSKGKGSVSALTDSLLRAAGHRVGLFTGPHLVDFCERIRVDGRKIPDGEFVRLVNLLRPVAEKLVAAMPPHHYLGPVGMTLAVALLWYREQNTDFHVVECGRGALADDTNVLWNNWSLLAPVMLEHSRYLGPTLLDIAANKLAVVKPGQKVCVSARQQPEVARLARSLCRRFRVPLKMAGVDFDYTVQEWDLGGSNFLYCSARRRHLFRVPLAGEFQAANAAAAIALVEEIEPDLENDVLQAGLDRVYWPGRCEVIPGRPNIILDGAINRQSASYLERLLDQVSPPLQIITAVPEDKDWQGVIARLAPRAENFWLTSASNPHLQFPDPERAVAEAKRYNRASSYLPTVEGAMLEAAALAGEGTVVVAGTQSMIRDAKLVLIKHFDREEDQ